MQLQQKLQQTLVEEELMREQRGGSEIEPPPRVHKGMALLDGKAYSAMLPDEQLEINLFGA